MGRPQSIHAWIVAISDVVNPPKESRRAMLPPGRPSVIVHAAIVPPQLELVRLATEYDEPKWTSLPVVWQSAQCWT